VWINNSGYDQATISAGRLIIGLCLLSGLLIFVLVSLITTRRLVIPLGRLIDKTRHLREFPFEGEGGPAEELTYDEPGEWFELERALNNLGRDLRSKTVRLSREKTEFRAIVTAVTEAVLAITKEKRLLFYNPQFAQLFDMQHVGGDTRIAEVLRSPDVLETYREALESGHPIRREVQIILPDERIPHHFQLSVAPLKKKHNQEVYGAVGIFHDITELVRADKIRIEFVGNVSHEIRTPLTTINGYMQTLVSDFEKGRFDQAGEFLGVVNQNVKRLKSLLDDLLDLSAIESGKDLHIENLNVMEITEGALKQVRHADHEIHVRHDFETLAADAKRIEQVLRNLLENAVRYVPKGGRIDVHWKFGQDGKPELRVRDNGPGIAEEHQSRLFERFYRVDEARSRETGGTGIGLSLVKHIMQRHGGRVYVQSQVGHGAEFVCEFQAPDQAIR
jgi:two-component system phosphate regulon sensor histidine kinase PhoR